MKSCPAAISTVSDKTKSPFKATSFLADTEALFSATTMPEFWCVIDPATDAPVHYFGQMRLDKHFHGQFFTPIHICEFMAAITFGDKLPTGRYLKVAEPACGSGAMIIGAVRHFKKLGVNNLGGKLLIQATDIDSLCVNMAYLQLGILGLSVQIVHGNTLTLEAWDAFDTPNLQINNCLGYYK